MCPERKQKRSLLPEVPLCLRQQPFFLNNVWDYSDLVSGVRGIKQSELRIPHKRPQDQGIVFQSKDPVCLLVLWLAG